MTLSEEELLRVEGMFADGIPATLPVADALDQMQQAQDHMDQMQQFAQDQAQGQQEQQQMQDAAGIGDGDGDGGNGGDGGKEGRALFAHPSADDAKAMPRNRLEDLLQLRASLLKRIDTRCL